MALIFFLLILGVPFAFVLIEVLRPDLIEQLIYHPSGGLTRPTTNDYSAPSAYATRSSTVEPDRT